MMGAIVVADVAPWLALVGAVGAAVAIFRSSQVKSSMDVMKSTIDVISTGNSELRAELDGEKRDREADRRRCDSELAEMRGQLKTLTGDFGKQIAQAIVEEWRLIEKPSVTESTTVQHTTTTKGTKP